MKWLIYLTSPFIVFAIFWVLNQINPEYGSYFFMSIGMYLLMTKIDELLKDILHVK